MSSVKVHGGLCSEIQKLIDRVSNICPEIEAARPRASGMEALTLLTSGVSKANSLIHHCTDSSILYLVLTGKTILSRCKKFRNLVEHSLILIQHTVPMILATKISEVLISINTMNLCLDPLESEAGNILRDLVNTYDPSAEEFALSAIHNVCSRLQLCSQKALLFERRSIRYVVDNLDASKRDKRKLLIFFLNLINKYMKTTLQLQSSSSPAEGRCNTRLCDEDIMTRPVPPKEFLCPLSARLMLNPVIIASGQTFERMWIQKWFDEGHSTCPMTGLKLDHLSFIPNVVIKGIIAKWCADHNFRELDAKMVKSWEASSNSISSLRSCISKLGLD